MEDITVVIEENSRFVEDIVDQCRPLVFIGLSEVMIGISEVGPGIKGRTVRVVSALPIPVGIICIQRIMSEISLGEKFGAVGKNWLDGESIQSDPVFIGCPKPIPKIKQVSIGNGS